MEENIVFVKDFFDRQVIRADFEESLDEFLRRERLNALDVVCDKNPISKGDYLVVNSKKTVVHVVKPGDTLQRIAEKYNVDANVIEKKNKTNKIFVGQQLII